jgi:D-beta-D-heptose 7-phosphate kinase/D-beta-D-heptose 1-phosphate adenosyltransferase
LIVDPKKDDFSLYKNTHIITPNLNELQRATKIKIGDNQSIIDACNDLIKKYNFNYIVAKKGSKGITIVGKSNFVKHIEAHPIVNPDVTGAGDTVISALSIAYAKTQDIELSAEFANSAAAIAVSKSGTATVTIDEINNYIETGS